jgi:hypothetical protein
MPLIKFSGRVQPTTGVLVNAHGDIRGLVDAVAFSRGEGLHLAIEHCIPPNADTPMPLRNGDPALAALCPFGADEALAAVDRERRLMKPINDPWKHFLTHLTLS